jgi:hypothetical protein
METVFSFERYCLRSILVLLSTEVRSVIFWAQTRFALIKATMDAPTISTLAPGPDEDEGRVAASQTSTFVAYAPPKSPPHGTGKFRLSKIKLRVPERDAAEEPPRPASSIPTFNVAPYTSQQRQDTPTGEGDEDEEDQLVDDDLGTGGPSSQQSQSVKPPPAKKARTRAPKNAYPSQSQASTLLSQSTTPGRADGDHDTMISAWQVNSIGQAPLAVSFLSITYSVGLIPCATKYSMKIPQSVMLRP